MSELPVLLVMATANSTPSQELCSPVKIPNTKNGAQYYPMFFLSMIRLYFLKHNNHPFVTKQ